LDFNAYAKSRVIQLLSVLFNSLSCQKEINWDSGLMNPYDTLQREEAYINLVDLSDYDNLLVYILCVFSVVPVDLSP